MEGDVLANLLLFLILAVAFWSGARAGLLRMLWGLLGTVLVLGTLSPVALPWDLALLRLSHLYMLVAPDQAQAGVPLLQAVAQSWLHALLLLGSGNPRAVPAALARVGDLVSAERSLTLLVLNAYLVAAVAMALVVSAMGWLLSRLLGRFAGMTGSSLLQGVNRILGGSLAATDTLVTLAAMTGLLLPVLPIGKGGLFAQIVRGVAASPLVAFCTGLLARTLGWV